ncbi:MAG TPA: pyrroloquinoline quinone biosynthesis peptide chaperone PqqD [Candidatus Cybelea sp.]|nr:pyrroloquinoline quinone biosynthesis peptide chaperone PqqD [Candidatus Cybelea sp.]
MNEQTSPRFGKGVKLRREPDGSAMLLVPEGALVLNPVATAALELVDGAHSLGEIVETVVDRFDVTPERAREDVAALFERLMERGFVRPSDVACPERSRGAQVDKEC